MTHVAMGVELDGGASWDFGDVTFTDIKIEIKWNGTPGTNGDWCKRYVSVSLCSRHRFPSLKRRY